MGKFEGMLFCTDLDGTLFSDRRVASERNLEAIEYFKSEGGYFTFITGRVPITAGAICRLIKPNAPYGCFNGGAIYDPFEEKYLWSRVMPDCMPELVRTVDEQLPEVGIQLNTERRIYICKDSPAMAGFRAIPGVSLFSCPYEEISEPVLKVVLAHRENEVILALQKLLQSHPRANEVDFIRSEHHLYEILPKGVSKGQALLKMADLLGVSHERTVVVGDYNNDISMVQAAGVGFAVANAVPELKAVADHVTVSNNEDAVAVIIDQLDRGMYL